MSCLRFVQDHFDALVPLFLVVEFTCEHVVEMVTVLARLVPQVVEHLLGAEVLTGCLLGVHQALPDRQKLVLVHLDHLSQLPLFFIQAGILLLLLAKLRSGIQQLLEVS